MLRGRRPAAGLRRPPTCTLCEDLYGQPGAVDRARTSPTATRAKVVPGETLPDGQLVDHRARVLPTRRRRTRPRYDGALFFADYSRNCIWVMQRGGGDAARPEPRSRRSSAGAANPVDLADRARTATSTTSTSTAARSGGIQLHRRQPAADARVATATPTAGPLPLTVHFDGTGSSDPDPGDTLTYAWDLDGDGAYDDSTAADADASPTRRRASTTSGCRSPTARARRPPTTVTITAGNTPPTADDHRADVEH